MPVFGLNSGTMPIMGYNYGARNRKRIMEALKYGCIYAFSIMCLGMLIFQLHSDFMLRLFEASDEMMAIGVPALKIISYSFPFAALCIMGCLPVSGNRRRQAFLLFLRPSPACDTSASGLHILPYPRPVRRMVCLPHI